MPVPSIAMTATIGDVPAWLRSPWVPVGGVIAAAAVGVAWWQMPAADVPTNDELANACRAAVTRQYKIADAEWTGRTLTIWEGAHATVDVQGNLDGQPRAYRCVVSRDGRATIVAGG